MVKINLNNVSNGFEPLESGNYSALFTKYEVKMDVPEGKVPFVNTTFVLVDDEHKNRQLFQKFFLSEKALYRFKQFLIAIGADPDALDSDDEEGVEINDILDHELGAKVTLVVGPNDYVNAAGVEVHSNKIEEIRGREFWE
jgi:pyruvate/2-oxoglutarate dehydrogenase complex dihydrolipoamide dehydrogenase (E3) component